MAVLSLLLSVAEPSGFWITIIRAFENVTNNYVLAIIFLTVVIKLIWTPIDTFNRRSQQKMSQTQAKMQPELDAINKKYAKDPNLLKQKQNEVYKKYNSKSMGGCFLMLVFMALNLTIFFTLFSGLNAMGAYKISESYDYLKYSYANVLEVTNKYIGDDASKAKIFNNPENLVYRIEANETNPENMEIVLLQLNGESETELARSEYKTDFSTTETEIVDGQEQTVVTETTNEYLNSVLTKFDGIVLKETVIEGSDETEKYTLTNAVTDASSNFIVERYQSNKESFLWIDNIWISDSPFNQSIVDYNGYVSQIGQSNVEEGEETIYNAFMPNLQTKQSRVNGYFILPILCILASVLTTLLSTRLGKKKGEKTPNQNKWLAIIMPIIFGVFALFYNCVFAIYMLTSQVMTAVTLPVQNVVLRAIDNRKKKKEEEKTEIDYTRKF